jgi:CheY-like chemotaxis protein
LALSDDGIPGLRAFTRRGLVFTIGGDDILPNSLGGRWMGTEQPNAAATSARRPKILIIDDDDLVAGTLVHSLKAEFDVVAIHDARQALDRVLSDPSIDLVYCDLMMKGLTGMDIYDQVRERAPQHLPKLVFMTGGAFTKRASTFIEHVGDAVVYKPFSIMPETRRRLAGTGAAPTPASPDGAKIG